jgi:FixJ family two-component response regulator
MTERSGFEGIYRTVDSPKRRREIADRVAWGMGVKQIAADLGVSRGAVERTIEQLRAEGEPAAGPAAAGA